MLRCDTGAKRASERGSARNIIFLPYAIFWLAMRALANVHGIMFSFMKSIGGKEALLREFPTIKEQVRV